VKRCRNQTCSRCPIHHFYEMMITFSDLNEISCYCFATMNLAKEYDNGGKTSALLHVLCGSSRHGRNFFIKCGGQLDVKPCSNRVDAEVKFKMPIPNLVSKGLLKATLIKFGLSLQMIYILIYLSLLLDTVL